MSTILWWMVRAFALCLATLFGYAVMQPEHTAVAAYLLGLCASVVTSPGWGDLDG